ncbi:hypothetical protein GOBAR_AA05966 [Gossypium barbadense]|uniref:Uncharacterized protein n=1 Tax=Gossypium barbadense TaxID=3634 RepID=A0A2P5YG67_GOSBA|nr:hypothetical protein GOBAR_AA05966 [Gossypium barbadense]
MHGIPPLVSTDQFNNKFSEFLSSKWGFKISEAKGETDFRRHSFEHARKRAYEICHLANDRCGYNMQKVVDAFVTGDQDQANKILEQKNLVGSFIRSHSLLSFSRNTEIGEEMLLELHDHGIREAIQLLKYHLSSLAGILCNFLML